MSRSLNLALDWSLAEEVNPDELNFFGCSQKRFSPPPDHDNRVECCVVELLIGSDASVQFTSVKRRITLLSGEAYCEDARDVSLHNFLVPFNRRNDAQLNLQNADLGDSKSAGMIALNQVDAFVQLLMQDGGVPGERRATAEIIVSRAP
jgi:ferric-dicitrate binding protein FerR (iron transport regulator)